VWWIGPPGFRKDRPAGMMVSSSGPRIVYLSAMSRVAEMTNMMPNAAT
jgi:hypothetical protein